MVTSRDVAWLAGIIEGEGTINVPSGRQALFVAVAMTDRDVVERVADMFSGTVRIQKSRSALAKRELWITTACGARAAGVLMAVYAFMGVRRKAKIRDALTVWLTRPGKRARNPQWWWGKYGVEAQRDVEYTIRTRGL